MDSLFYKLYSNPLHGNDTAFFRNYSQHLSSYQLNSTQNSTFETHELQIQDQTYHQRKISNTDFYFPFLIGNLILLIVILTIYKTQFTNSILALFSSKYYQKIELITIIKHPINFIFFAAFTINLSLITLYSFSSSHFLPFQPLELTISNLMIGIFSFYFIKIILILISAQIFKVPSYGRIYVDHIFLWFINMAFLSALFLWLFIYQDNSILIPIFISIWLLLEIVRLANTFTKIIPKSNFNLFHFFMYLCAVEILPLIVLGKLVMMGT